MFQQWKLILQKTNLKNLTLIIFGIFSVILIVVFVNFSCGVNYVLISTDISSYEQSLNPEFCEMIVDRIDMFNDDCESQIEILDCS